MTFPSIPTCPAQAYDGLQWVAFRELFDLSAIQRCYGRTVELEQVVKAGGSFPHPRLTLPQRKAATSGENEQDLGVELQKRVGKRVRICIDMLPFFGLDGPLMGYGFLVGFFVMLMFLVLEKYPGW